MTDERLAACAKCPYDWAERYCRGEKGKAPADCPSINHRNLVRQSLEVTKDEKVLPFARQASIQEAEGYGGREQGYAAVYPIKPRIVETVEFARRMGYRRLGLLFCVGLRREAAVVQEILETNGFEVVSVCCKVGRVPKDELGLDRSQQIDPNGPETMCNPVLQAEVCNRQGTQFNILLGLCVGHDSLALGHSQAPCTVLAVKDRLLGHNPLAAIYNYQGYYRYLKNSL